MWYFSFAAKRLRHRWQSLLTVIVGVFLAAIIGANASLYTGAIAGVGLIQYLDTRSAADSHVYARAYFSPLNVGDVHSTWDRYNAVVRGVRDEVFGASPWMPQTVAGAETQAMFVLRDGVEVPETRLRIAYSADAEDHTIVTDGIFPNTQMSMANAIPVAMHESTADELGVGVGDFLEIDQRGWESSQIFRVEVVALIRERDPNAAYWMQPSLLRREVSATSGYEASLLTTRPALEEIVVQYIPQPTVQVNWRVLFPHERFAVSRLDRVSAEIESFERTAVEQIAQILDDDSFVTLTNLPDLLSDYGGNIDLLNVPTGLILLQLGALVLFFLVVISALVRRGERREIALLQSRGVYDRQILLLSGIESLLICTFAALLAPYLARAILTALLPLFTGIRDVPLPLTPTIFAYAFLASMTGLVVLVATMRPVLQQPLILAGGSAARSGGQTWWQRYYIDVVLLVAGVVAFTQLGQDRVLMTATDGTIQVDPLLLLTPALLFFAFSSILLRFFPLIMSMVAKAAARRDALVSVLATWQVSREPLHYGRITFLLALAIGIGGFAVTYQATLLGNDQDQALYEVGADVRIVYDADAPSDVLATIRRELAQLPGVEALMDKAIRHHTKQVVDTFQSTGCEIGCFPDSGGMLAVAVRK